METIGVVLAIQTGDELGPARHAELLEDRLDVVPDGVRGQEQFGRDLGRRATAGDGTEDIALAFGQRVGLDDDRRDLRALGRFYDDGDGLAAALARAGASAEAGAVHGRRMEHEPPA